jgi:hypothetical protein
MRAQISLAIILALCVLPVQATPHRALAGWAYSPLFLRSPVFGAGTDDLCAGRKTYSWPPSATESAGMRGLRLDNHKLFVTVCHG